jgi:SAM-dependent methyltransferase
MDGSSGIDRSSGRSLFGHDPSLYERARPAYPERVYEVLVERCGLATGSRIFEVGAGTGQVTSRLAQAGAGVVAIEPDPGLAALLAERTKTLSTVSIHIGPFESASLPSASFDLGVAATSFHWIDPARGLPKVRRLLVPGGWWAMWWTVFMDTERPDPFYEATDSIVSPLPRGPSAAMAGRPPFALDIEARSAELMTAGMERVETELIRWTAHFDARGIRRLYSTFSSISGLALDEREAVLDTVEAIAEDSFNGHVERPFQTIVYTSQRA